MNRAQRKLRLARRQALLAMLGEREAMRALSVAIGEEARSAALKQRSESLMGDYTARMTGEEGPADAGELAALSRFTGALGLLARDAGRAHADAADQALWQADALAAAQTRARRLHDHLTAARSALDQARVAKAALEESLARELQKRERSQDREQSPEREPSPERDHFPSADGAPTRASGSDAG